MRYLIPALFLCVAAVTFAADAPDNAPRSTAAKSAIIKADRAEKQAEAAYKRAMSDIYRKLVLDLADARTAVMRDGGRDALAEATRIQAVIDATNQKLAAVDGRAQTFTIYANKDWQPTIEVRKGDKITVKAEGKWNWYSARGAATECGPDGQIDPSQRKRMYYLAGRIGERDSFKIGSSLSFIADHAGMLSMQMADAGLDDNAGQLAVTISAPSHAW